MQVVRSSMNDGTNQTTFSHTKNSPMLPQDEDIFEESL